MSLLVKGSRLISLGTGNIVTDGTEQTLVEEPGGMVSQVLGYVDLVNLAGGDTVMMKLYAKVKDGGQWRAYHEENYAGVQALPLVYVTKKPEHYGLKVTLQQTAGSYKTFEYNFLKES